MSAPWSGITHTELTRNPRGVLISAANNGARRNQQPSHKDCDMTDSTGGSRGRWRAGVLAAAVAGTALLVAACGAGGSSVAGSTAYQKAVAFAQCMRSHGEPGWPDPNSQGNFLINGRKDHLNGGPQMQSATKACQHLDPNTPMTPAQQRQAANQALKFVACMRAHGLPNMPDPVVNANGIEIRMGAGVSPGSAQLKAAQQACRSLMPGLGGGS
jgi:hypothetical protein